MASDAVRLGHYRLLDEIGRGGMGVVYRALDTRDGTTVAIKRLLPALAGDSLAVARLHREASIISMLEHPSIGEIIEFVSQDEQAYLVMPFVEGSSLDRALEFLDHQSPTALAIARENHLQCSAAVVFATEVCAQVASALAYAHSLGVVHRDVKPGNILVRSDGQVVLTDFGIAHFRSGEATLTATGHLSGTLDYLAPEQILGGGAGAAADIYALGVTLYESLTGVRPFRAANPLQLQQRILTATPQRPSRHNSRVPAELDRITLKALEKRPLDRYETAEEMHADLRRFLAAQPVVARPIPVTVRAARWCARNRLATSALVAAVLAVTVIGWLWHTARVSLSDYRLLNTGLRATALVEAFEAVPPAWPEYDGRHLELLNEARALTDLLPALEQRMQQSAPGRGGLAEDALPTTVELQFSNPGTLRLLEQVRRVAYGILPALVERRKLIADQFDATVARHRDQWERVQRDLLRDPRFGDLELAPQVGLIPVGKSGESGLWEFAHWRSGTPLDPLQNSRPGGDTGMVFVLLPPGVFLMGEQSADPTLPNYHAAAPSRDGPVHRASVGNAFFISKFELTRGQWLRLGGTVAENDAPDAWGVECVDAVPLTNKSLDELQRVLRACGLDAPTEVEWEYACRAGVGSGALPWNPDAQAGCANVRDRALAREAQTLLPPPDWPYAPFNDGFAQLAPVGRFAPNGFGLHDMLGNAYELCRTPLTTNYASGERTPAGEFAVRGGSYLHALTRVSPGARNGVPRATPNRTIGIRPVRPVAAHRPSAR